MTFGEICEDHACAAIMRERGRRSIVMPRYTPSNWWECDVFELTAAGYFREYEVKLTRADFFADAKKERELWNLKDGYTKANKHGLLTAGDVRGPVEFYYVAPEGLLHPTDLPPFAGLIELADRGSDNRPTWRYRERTIVEAPRLHRTKADPKIRTSVLSCCYHRLHASLDRLRDSTREPKEWTDTPAPETSIC